ncbi:MAG: hypothetical protein RJA70_386 [Pseudomonadota bacterium]|jgi:septal ring factor EnvC (AmiA/AmiB activator)
MKLWALSLGVLTVIGLGPSHEAQGNPLSVPLGEADLLGKLQEFSAEHAALKQRIELRGRSYVRLIRLGLLPVSDGFAGFVDHAQRAELMGRLLARDIARQGELERQAKALEAAIGSWRGRPEQALSAQSGYRRSQEAILAAQEREAAFRRAFDGKPTDHTTVYGSVGTGPLPERFVELKGRLTFPVEGQTRVRSVASGDEYGPGLMFQVEAGNLPRAVYRGRVIMIGDYGDLGRGVIIEHGDGYSTVTANLKTVFVEAGASVSAGTALGELQSKRGETELYLELRHAGLAVAPAEWFGL